MSHKFKYKSMSVISVVEGLDETVISANQVPKTTACSQCSKGANIVRFGTLKEKIVDKPVSGKRVVIHLKKQRWRCLECGTTFTDENKDKYGTHKITKGLAKYLKKNIEKKTISSLAKNTGLARSTVRSVLNPIDSVQR